MINMTHDSECYIVKFNDGSFLTREWLPGGDGDVYPEYDITREICSSMFFKYKNVNELISEVKAFLYSYNNKVIYKLTSYTIHRINYTQTISEIISKPL